MASSKKTIQTTLSERDKLRNMAKAAQAPVKKMLPLGATNINREVLLSLEKKLKNVFIKSNYIIEEVLQEPVLKAQAEKAPAIVKEKMLDCKIETLRLMIARFGKELENEKLNFTDAELRILPAFCAANIGDILFKHEKKRSVMEDGVVVKIKKLVDMAYVTGTGNCQAATYAGMVYLLQHHGQHKGLYPIYNIFIDPVQGYDKTPKAINFHTLDGDAGHHFFVVHFDCKHPVGPDNKAIFCDFWIDHLADDLKDIVEKLPEHIRAYTRTNHPCVQLVLQSPISEKEQDDLKKANPYQSLRPLFHYTMKMMYEMLTKKALPLKYYLVDEKVYPKTSELYHNTLSEEERKAFCEWDAKVMPAYIRGLEKYTQDLQVKEKLKEKLKGLLTDARSSSANIPRASTPTVNSTIKKPNTTESYPKILLLSDYLDLPTSCNKPMAVPVSSLQKEKPGI